MYAGCKIHDSDGGAHARGGSLGRGWDHDATCSGSTRDGPVGKSTPGSTVASTTMQHHSRLPTIGKVSNQRSRLHP